MPLWKSTRTYFVWTEETERLHPDRKAGEPVWEAYRTCVPRSWYDNGWVREAIEKEVDAPSESAE